MDRNVIASSVLTQRSTSAHAYTHRGHGFVQFSGQPKRTGQYTQRKIVQITNAYKSLNPSPSIVFDINRFLLALHFCTQFVHRFTISWQTGWPTIGRSARTFQLFCLPVFFVAPTFCFVLFVAFDGNDSLCQLGEMRTSPSDCGGDSQLYICATHFVKEEKVEIEEQM